MPIFFKEIKKKNECHLERIKMEHTSPPPPPSFPFIPPGCWEEKERSIWSTLTTRRERGEERRETPFRSMAGEEEKREGRNLNCTINSRRREEDTQWGGGEGRTFLSKDVSRLLNAPTTYLPTVLVYKYKGSLSEQQ